MFDILIPLVILFLNGANAVCAPPNGTAEKFHWWPCNPNDSIVYESLALKNTQGQDIYPVKIKQPFVVDAKIDNTNGELNNLTTAVKLWQWTGRRESNCRWNEITTFGILNNLIKCGKGIKCPVESGKQNLEITVDLSSLSIVAGLLPNNTPFKVEYKITGNGASESTCLTLETLVQTK